MLRLFFRCDFTCSCDKSLRFLSENPSDSVNRDDVTKLINSIGISNSGSLAGKIFTLFNSEPLQKMDTASMMSSRKYKPLSNESHQDLAIELTEIYADQSDEQLVNLIKELDKYTTEESNKPESEDKKSITVEKDMKQDQRDNDDIKVFTENKKYALTEDSPEPGKDIKTSKKRSKHKPILPQVVKDRGKKDSSTGKRSFTQQSAYTEKKATEKLVQQERYRHYNQTRRGKIFGKEDNSKKRKPP